MPRFELYRKADEVRRQRSGASGARMFAVMLLLWAAILLWASQVVFGL
ncbi:MAG: hypothetical protein WCY15_04270 [Phenylobacterium sp.]|jgi:hypothetical protein|nr:hypothetical protein [Phenylobacterium sp.]MDX9998062.1 hypothetical protein [Phenylobacterium sp.]